MIDKIQTIGLAAKGAVYSIIGILTALTAFDMGGKKTGKSGVIDFLQKQPFGKFILYALAVGILSYALWRLYTAFTDAKNKGSDVSGIFKRIGYGISGLLYLAFAASLVMATIGSGGSSSSSKQHYADKLMDKPFGPYLIGLIGLIIFGIGIYQIYKGYSGKYMEELNASESSLHEPIEKTGKFGFMARGVVFCIIGYFVASAAVTQNPAMVRGTQGAFSFLQQQSYGWILMGVIAIGLLGYGIFMVFVAKYSHVRS